MRRQKQHDAVKSENVILVRDFFTIHFQLELICMNLLYFLANESSGQEREEKDE